MKIKELMNYSRQNEGGGAKSGKHIRLKMTGAVALGLLGLICLYVAFTVRIDVFSGFANMFLMAAGIILQGASLMLFTGILPTGYCFGIKRAERGCIISISFSTASLRPV
ncbi:hypothetical protein LC724_02835 [Blautia sp. RD014234]|nr:hypothetical protein [Blautia parvula]